MDVNEKDGKREKRGNQDKKANKPSSAGRRTGKFARFHDNTLRNKAARMLRANGFNDAKAALGIGPVMEVVKRAKKTSTNFAKWCERRKVPAQFR